MKEQNNSIFLLLTYWSVVDNHFISVVHQVEQVLVGYEDRVSLLPTAVGLVSVGQISILPVSWTHLDGSVLGERQV